MKYFLACVSTLALSFSAAAAEKNADVTYTQPLTKRDTHLTCKSVLGKGQSLTTPEKDSYLEGTGEQIQFALIATDHSSEVFKVFFDSWGFTPFGLIESHAMHENESLIHVGGRSSVGEHKIDYSFVDTRPQDGLKQESKTAVFLYDCQHSAHRPSWVEKELVAAKTFRGSLPLTN